MKAVIMAGGKGTRIAEIAPDIPKPMIAMAGKPVLEHQILCLKAQGIVDITLVTGHLGEVIPSYFGDGRKWGVSLHYFHEEVPLGSCGALYYLKDRLSEDFLLINGDVIFDVNISKFAAFHREHRAVVSLTTHPNNHPFDSALIVTAEDHRVVQWLHKEEPRVRYRNRVNAGIHLLSPQILEGLTEPKKLDLDRDLLKPLVASGSRIFAYDTPEYIKDMGTPERFHKVTRDIESGLVHRKNLGQKQKAVFLDRDGTINEYRGFVRTPDELVLLPGTEEAIRRINASGYLAIVITNQPVIARGDCTFEQLDEIHNQMETELGKAGAYVDAIYFCPHHPDSGYAGERPEFKIACECRKPKPGLLIRAAMDFNIDLSESYMVGDSDIDMEAGYAAGTALIYVGNPPGEKELTAGRTVLSFPSLLAFVENTRLNIGSQGESC